MYHYVYNDHPDNNPAVDEQMNTSDRRYPIDLPVYDVIDVDTGELLGSGVDMKAIVRGWEITHVMIRRIPGGFKKY